MKLISHEAYFTLQKGGRNENKNQRIPDSGKEQYSPSLMLAYRIAGVFGVSVEELCCLKENKEQEDREYENL